MDGEEEERWVSCFFARWLPRLVSELALLFSLFQRRGSEATLDRTKNPAVVSSTSKAKPASLCLLAAALCVCRQCHHPATPNHLPLTTYTHTRTWAEKAQQVHQSTLQPLLLHVSRNRLTHLQGLSDKKKASRRDLDAIGIQQVSGSYDYCTISIEQFLATNQPQT